MNIKLSIIIATYNSGKTLRDTLNSVLLQTFKEFEIIVIDGLSNDNTMQIVYEFEEKFKIIGIPFYWISEKDTGIYDAWNKGLTKTNSPWIAFLGSDDTYYPNALEIYIAQINKNSNINYICSKVEYVDSNNNVLRILGNPYSYSQMIRYMDIAHVGSFHNIELFETYGNFDTTYKIVGDYDFFMKCGKEIKPAFIDKITARMLNSGISNNNIKNALNEVLATQLKYKKTNLFQIYFEYYYAILRIMKNRITTVLLDKLLKK